MCERERETDRDRDRERRGNKLVANISDGEEQKWKRNFQSKTCTGLELNLYDSYRHQDFCNDECYPTQLLSPSSHFSFFLLFIHVSNFLETREREREREKEREP